MNHKQKWNNFITDKITKALDPQKSYEGERLGALEDFELLVSTLSRSKEREDVFSEERMDFFNILTKESFTHIDEKRYNALTHLFFNEFNEDSFKYVQFLSNINYDTHRGQHRTSKGCFECDEIMFSP